MDLTTRSESSLMTKAVQPWQLRMFRRTLKKQQKLARLLKTVGPLDGQRCLLLTCGDNNGALNWHFREHGGQWTWADMEENSAAQIAALTGDPVLGVDKDAPVLPVPEQYFDVVMTIDVHEHLQETERLNQELARVTRTGGKVIVTTPGGEPQKWANRIKRLLGMQAADYGHVVDGYSASALQSQLQAAGLTLSAHSSYSRFFTEMLELAINVVYVKLLSKKSKARVEQGQIAPQNQEQLHSVEKSYRVYSLVYPTFWLISQLDRLLFFTEGYAVIVTAMKE